MYYYGCLDVFISDVVFVVIEVLFAHSKLVCITLRCFSGSVRWEIDLLTTQHVCVCAYCGSASTSEDQTMATWGGSTAGNLESIEENEGRSDDEDDDDEDMDDDDDDKGRNDVAVGLARRKHSHFIREPDKKFFRMYMHM